VGWNWSLQIARYNEVWVLTRRNNRRAVDAALADRGIADLHPVYFDLPGWARFWKRGGRGVHLYYALWQIGAYFVARNLHRRVGFDLMHHVSFVNYWLGSLLPFLPVPFVWGPVGGGESYPTSFLRSFGWRGRLYELLRAAVRRLAERNPVLRLAASRVMVALGTTRETGERLERLCGRPVEVLSQVGMSREEIAFLGSLPRKRHGPLRVLSIGRLLHWKGFHLGLLAFAQIAEECENSEYHLIGDGPEARRLVRLAERLGVGARVRFWGAIRREEALDQLGASSVLLHPSLHDSGGWVCLEAMAAGRPVICLDLGGPATQVTPETGFLIPARTPQQAVADIAAVLRRIASDPTLRARLGEAGRKRAERIFDWEAKGREMNQVYEGCFR